MRSTIALLTLPLLTVPASLDGQSCPKSAGEEPGPRVEVHLFQPSCDTPLLSGKRAVGRVWAIWLDDPEGGEPVREFPARITVRDGAGRLIAAGTHTFRRPPWQGLETRRAEHTFEFAFRPLRGVTESPISVEVEPLKQGEVDLFSDPGVRPFEFEDGNPARADGRRILRISYVIPLVGDWSEGDYTAATRWISRNAGRAEDFLVQNHPVHAVRRAGVYPIDVAEWDTGEAPCIANPVATCVHYETPGFDEQVELYLARQFVELADVSIVVVLLPEDYAGDYFRGRTVLFDAEYRTRAALSSGDLRAPDYPVIVLPVTSRPWVLAHEMAHFFLGRGHVDLDKVKELDADREMRETARSEGIHAFRVPFVGTILTANKHSTEGNGEDVVLDALLKDGPSPIGLRRRFVSDGVYRELLDAVRESGPAIWASIATDETRRGPAESLPASRTAPAAGTPAPGAPWAGPYAPSLSPPSSASGVREVGRPQIDESVRQEADMVPHLVVRGAVGPAGNVVLDALGVAMMHPRSENTTGTTHRLEVRDVSGRILASRGFEPAPSVLHEQEGRIDDGSSFFVAVPYSPDADRIVVLDASGTERATVSRSGRPLEVDLESADVDENAGTVRVEWTLSGGRGDETAELLYSPDGIAGWTPAARGLSGGTAVVPTTGLRRGPEPTFRLVATNGFDWTMDEREADLERFDVWSKNPAPGDSTPTDGAVSVVLSSDLDIDGSEAELFVLEDGTGDRLAAEVGYAADASLLWLVPEDPLSPGQVHRVRLSDDLEDRWGHGLRREVEWTFHTEPDTLPPRVMEASPRDGDITVPVTVEPSVTFDEALSGEMDAGLRLETVQGAVVAGTVTYEANDGRLFFRPSVELGHRTVYRLIVSPEIRDASGNPVGEVPPVTFTTGGAISVGGRR